MKINRYLMPSSPSSLGTNNQHKQIKISINCLGFGNRECMDCKLTITLLQNGDKSIFYQKFPSRWLSRDDDNKYLECNALSLSLFNKLSIKIEMKLINHKIDDSLS